MTVTADEAQAITASEIEVGRIRDGVAEPVSTVAVPEEYMTSVHSAVIENLSFSRLSCLRGYPKDAAYEVVETLVNKGLIAKRDAEQVRDLVELEIRGALEYFAVDARNRFDRRLPVTLRSLIPLITIRSGSK